MPKQSKIESVHLTMNEWIKNQNPPKGVFIGKHYGVDCVVIRYSVDGIGEGPDLHVHPYDELFHIIKGKAEFTVGKDKFIAEEGAMIIGPANIPHMYKNIGPGRLDSVDIHLSNEWIQYDLPYKEDNN